MIDTKVMKVLLEQVPELSKKLRVQHNTKTIHRNDLKNFPEYKEGDVVKFTTWIDKTGYQWNEAMVGK